MYMHRIVTIYVVFVNNRLTYATVYHYAVLANIYGRASTTAGM